MDLGALVPKKGQAMLAIEGFTPLVLALPVVIEPSPRFIKKGTSVIPNIRGFDPLVLPSSIQGISRAPSPNVLEAALPIPVIINPKMFSVAPNLQTQEGVVIRMLKIPFLG